MFDFYDSIKLPLKANGQNLSDNNEILYHFLLVFGETQNNHRRAITLNTHRYPYSVVRIVCIFEFGKLFIYFNRK